MFLFYTLLYFSTPLLTLLYLVSHQEFHEFPELRVSNILQDVRAPKDNLKVHTVSFLMLHPHQ